MVVRFEIGSFEELYDMVWSGAKDTLKYIIDNNKTKEFMEYAECMYDYNDSDIPTMTELNDWLWFDRDCILTDLDIDIE